MEEVDSLILQKIQKGDTQAFGQFYDSKVRKIYDFLYFKTFHKETAEDLTSVTFTKALEAISKGSFKGENINAWLFTIARNTVIDHYRTKKVDYNIDDVWDLDDGTDMEFDLDTKNKLEDVKEYLKDLKSTQREIVIMKVWQGMSYREISEIVGKSESNCKVIFSRTINKLRKEMPLLAFISFLTCYKI